MSQIPPRNRSTSHLIALVLALTLASGIGGACKPTYVDPVTGDEIACSTLPKADLDYIVQLGIELTMLIPDWGKIQQRVLQEGVIRGGCAIAAVVNRFLAPPSGIAVPPPEQSVAARGALEATRDEFLRLGIIAAKASGVTPPDDIFWINAQGQAQ